MSCGQLQRQTSDEQAIHDGDDAATHSDDAKVNKESNRWRNQLTLDKSRSKNPNLTRFKLRFKKLRKAQ